MGNKITKRKKILLPTKEYDQCNVVVLGARRTGKSTLVDKNGYKELFINSKKVIIRTQEGASCPQNGLFNGCVLVFDLQYEDTLKECLRSLSQMRQCGSGFPIVMAANKCDFFLDTSNVHTWDHYRLIWLSHLKGGRFASLNSKVISLILSYIPKYMELSLQSSGLSPETITTLEGFRTSYNVDIVFTSGENGFGVETLFKTIANRAIAQSQK